MRKKRRAIIQLSIILLVTIFCLLLCFVPVKIVGTSYTWEGFAANIKLGTDLKGGVYAVYQVAKDESMENLDERLDSTSQRLLSMIHGKGYSEATVTREENRLRVEVPDVDDPSSLFKLIGEPASMIFRVYDDSNGTNLLTTMEMTGKNIKGASGSYQDSQYGVSIEFDNKGAAEFSDITEKYKDKYLRIFASKGEAPEGATNSSDAFVEDGKYYELLTNAQLMSHITDGHTFVSGSFTQETADALAQQILAGAFDVKLTLLQSDVMSATLGVDALKYSLIAGLVAVIVIIVFLCAIYRGMGLVSGLALLIYTALFIFLMWSFPWVQLSLPGIAGIILSLGMAVDANVIIFERIREEYKIGRSINASVKAGFKRSLWTVLDANITTILASVVLIILGNGTVRGFGVTLLMGILLSLLTSLAVSRGLFNLFLRVNKTNAKFYGLKRDAAVEEIKDEAPKKKETENKDAIPFEIYQEQQKMRGGKDS